MRLVMTALLLTTAAWAEEPPALKRLPPNQEELLKQKEKLRVRDKNQAESVALAAKGDLRGAVAAAERMLACELLVYGEAHADLLRTHQSLADLSARLGNFEGAGAAAKRRLSVAETLYGPGHWQTTDAGLAAEGIRRGAVARRPRAPG